MPENDDDFFELAPSLEETFDTFYALFPRHEAKKDALKAWLALKPDAALLARILGDVRTRRWPERKQFILLPASYLRGYRWTDEPTDAGEPTPVAPANRWQPTANPKRLIHGGQGVCCPHEPICETDIECWRRQQGVWTEEMRDAVE